MKKDERKVICIGGVPVGGVPQEKVYLHTDRDHYEAGERVWFRAYLVNAVSHVPSDWSQFVYVELRDRQDSLFARVKVGLRDSVYAGYVPLAKTLPQGDYVLRAYSYWMQNGGDDYIFRKRIRVVSPQDSKVLTEMKEEETEEGAVAVVRFYNTRNECWSVPAGVACGLWWGTGRLCGGRKRRGSFA